MLVAQRRKGCHSIVYRLCVRRREREGEEERAEEKQPDIEKPVYFRDPSIIQSPVHSPVTGDVNSSKEPHELNGHAAHPRYATPGT